MKRLLDFLFSIFLIIALAPFMLMIGLIVVLSSKGPALFKQERVGRLRVNFMILKFRTMKTHSEQAGQLTVGGKDPRVTGIGYFLRKFKIDEWPQLWNIMMGEMSFVGPRPEVPKYVGLYTQDQLRVLNARPGLTDLASVVYYSENELLSKAADPEKEYIDNIMQEKLRLNLKHIDSQSFGKDIKIIGMTLLRLIRPAAE